VPEGEVIRLSSPNAQDSRVNQILVREGDRVQPGQLLAVLQGVDRLKADLRDAQTDVRLRQAELLKVQQGEAKQGEIAAQHAAIARLEAQLRTETPQRQAAIARARATLQDAELTYQRRQGLHREGAISLADLDAALREMNVAQADLDEQQATLEQTLTTLPVEIAQEQARLAELQEVRPIDVAIAKEQLEKARIAVEQQRASLDDVQIRSPIAGQVLRINTRIGEQVNTSQGILELARTDSMFVSAEISEVDIGKVREGQKAIVTSEYGGFQGEVRGTVENIGLQIGGSDLQDADTSGAAAENPGVDKNARVVIVKIRINPEDNPKVAAFTNMQVRVKLDIAANDKLVSSQFTH
jgi:HlyD family secretion protein